MLHVAAIFSPFHSYIWSTTVPHDSYTCSYGYKTLSIHVYVYIDLAMGSLEKPNEDTQSSDEVVISTQGRRYRGGRGGLSPPTFKSRGAEPPQKQTGSRYIL